MELKSFDPTKLFTAPVNPRKTAKPVLVYEIRVTQKTMKVDFTGLVEKLNLITNGINYTYDPITDKLIVWPVVKENAMTLKGDKMENKMASFVAAATQLGLVAENHKTTYLKLEEITNAPGYYVVVEDTVNSPVIDESIPVNTSPSEPTDAEIEAEVEAEVEEETEVEG